MPPQSIMKCLKLFGENGVGYFDITSRKPTARESRVEKMLDFLNQQQGPQKKGNRSLPPIIWKSSLYSHSGQEEG